MSYLEKNLAVLKNLAPDLYDEVASKEATFNVSNFELTDSYNFYCCYENVKCHLYSTYNIKKSIERQLSYINNQAETIVVFGFALGYEVEYIVNNLKNIKNIIIIEPNLNLFKEVLKYFDLADFVKRVNTVSFILNKDIEKAKEILFLLTSNFWDSNTEFVYNIAYRTIFNGYYEEVYKSLIKSIKSRTISISALDYLRYNNYFNFFKNILIPAIPIEKMIKKLSGVPFIIVSAGPSLNKNIELLREVKDRAVICAVGSSIKILENKGIKPHLRFAFDPTEEEGTLFNLVNNDDVGLVYSDGLYYEILPKYSGHKIRMILDTEYIIKYIYKRANIDFFEIMSGFSISTVATYIGTVCKCEKIIFMGQDLCFTNDRYYATGRDEKEEEITSFENVAPIKVKDVYGNEVYTMDSFIGTRNIFERHVAYNPDITFLNATEGGINISGATNTTFQDVLNNLDPDINVSKLLEELYSDVNYETMKKELDLIQNVIKDLKLEVELILKSIDKIIRKLKKINLLIYSENPEWKKVDYEIKKVEKLDEKLKEFDFYENVVDYTIGIYFSTIDINHKCYSYDKIDIMKNKFTRISNKTTIKFQFFEFLNQMLSEF